MERPLPTQHYLRIVPMAWRVFNGSKMNNIMSMGLIGQNIKNNI